MATNEYILVSLCWNFSKTMNDYNRAVIEINKKSSRFYLWAII